MTGASAAGAGEEERAGESVPNRSPHATGRAAPAASYRPSQNRIKRPEHGVPVTVSHIRPASAGRLVGQAFLPVSLLPAMCGRAGALVLGGIDILVCRRVGEWDGIPALRGIGILACDVRTERGHSCPPRRHMIKQERDRQECLSHHRQEYLCHQE